MKFSLKKIISGGQTGVDMGALEAATSCGINCGGWCPADGCNEQGPIPENFGLKPTKDNHSQGAPGIPRSQRTEWNVRDSDGTLVICLSGYPVGPGTKFTLKLAKELGKPLVEILLPDPHAVNRLVAWVHKHSISTLNVAGPSEREVPGIQSISFTFMMDFLQSTRPAQKKT